MLLMLLGLFNSCRDSANQDNIRQKTTEELQAMFITPDSLRTQEEKVLFRQLEGIMYEHIIIKNDKFVLNISEQDFLGRGLPKAAYDMYRENICDVNNYLDTTSVSWHKQSTFDAFEEAREEYKSRKE